MAMFAPVAPLPLMFEMKAMNILGNYHLLLAHDIVDEADSYTELFEDRTHHMCIILDNSLIELGHPVDDATMKRAAEIINPRYIVLPDFLSEGQKTYEASVKAAIRYRRLGLGPFMAVAQGKSPTELRTIAHHLASIHDVEALGVPRVITDTVMLRSMFVPQLRKMLPHMPLHLLGFSNNLADDIAAARIQGVRGIDSAVPLRMGLAGQKIDLEQENHTPRGDFWATATMLNEQAVENLKIVHEWLLVEPGETEDLEPIREAIDTSDPSGDEDPEVA